MIRAVLLPMMFVLASGGHPTPVPEGVADRDPSPAAAPLAPTPGPSPSDTPAATQAGPECPRPVVVPPRALANGWPNLVGRRVRLRVVPLRAIDFTTWLVVAGGQRFLVVAAPDTSWTAEHVFVVAGSAVAPVHGRTALPELVMDDECDT